MQSFEKHATEYAQKKGYDGIICGHIHEPKMTPFYMNTGCWTDIENCTAITEDYKGNLSIVYYKD